MSDGDPPTPPRRAAALLERRLPAEVRDALAGDLAERHAALAARHSRLLADLWYWKSALFVRARALRRQAASLERRRPSSRRGRASLDRAVAPPELLGAVAGDVRYALRRLARAPGFTVVAVLSLGLGIGANTAMFSVVNAALLRGAPLDDPDRWVEVYTSEQDGYPYATTSYPDFVDVRSRVDAFSRVIGYTVFIGTVERGPEPEVILGELVSDGYFDALGRSMASGRSFLPEETTVAGTHAVVVLGHDYWSEAFGADPDVLGSTVRVNQRPFTVVGVAPEGFNGMFPVLVADVFVPMMMADVLQPASTPKLSNRGSRDLFVKARLADGVSVQRAGEAVAALGTSLAELHPDTNEHRNLAVLASADVSLHPLVDRALVPIAALLLAVVGLVLLVACANLASFLLARGEDRRKEIALRLALGAGRGPLIRQLLVETTLLALLGGVAGVVIAAWTIAVTTRVQPPIPIPINFDFTLDATVLGFTAGVAVLAGLAFGLAPALQSTRPDLAPTLRGGGGGEAAGSRSRLRSSLVVVQVGFSVVLLIGAGLFLRSLQEARRIDPGFDTGPAGVIWPDLPLSGLIDEDEQRAAYEELEARLLAHPAIDRVALADRLPIGAGVQTKRFTVPGVPSEGPDGGHAIDDAHVSASYFDVMGVPIVRGRGFEPADVGGPPVLVVSEAFERRFFPGASAVGQALERTRGSSATSYRIVGVARDAKVRTLGEAPRPFVYHFVNQASLDALQVVVRGPRSSAELLTAARGVAREVAGGLVLIQSKTMEQHLSILLFAPRAAALLLGAFGGLALALSAIGIYGVVSHTVARRTREVGIRVSMGASAGSVIALLVAGGMRPVLLGGLIGTALAAAATWSLSGYLYAIGAHDAVTFASIPAVLGVVALLAAWIPARRAARVDPVRALRSE